MELNGPAQAAVAAANGTGSITNGTRPAGNSAEVESWSQQQGPRVAELLASGTFCDLVLLAGEPPQRVPAARLLLAAASKQLAQQLHLEELEPGTELALPKVSAAAARAVVAYSCGVERPFRGCSPKDARAAASALRVELPSGWWAHCEKESHQKSATPRVEEVDLDEASDTPPASAGASHSRARETTSAPEAPSHPHPRQRWRAGHAFAVAASLCLSAAPLAAYLPTRTFNMEVGGFFMDDVMIRKNTVVVGEAMDWHRLWRTDYWGLDMFDPNTWTHKSFRPLTVLTFRWNYLLTGFNSCGFHVCNVLLHGIASLQLFLFSFTVLHLPALWSGLVAALFAAHPVHSESICYVVGRADLLCTQMLLLAVQLYMPCTSSMIQLRNWLCLVGSVCLVIIAGLCKETGLTFFGLFVIWEALAITRPREPRQKQLKPVLFHILRIIVLFVVGGLACFTRVWYTAGTQIARMDPYSNPVAASEDPRVRQLSYALVHGMYMKLLAFPTFLCYDYSMDAVPLVESFSDLRLLLPVTTYLVFFQVSTTTLRRLRGQRHLDISATQRRVTEGLALSIAIFVLSFLPMTNILFPIGTLVGERLLYLPSLGFICAMVSLAYLETSGSVGKRARGRSSLALLVLFVIAACWAFLCYKRVLDWSSVERITLVDGLKQLRSSRTQFNLANIYLLENRHDEALLAYQRSIAADPQERDSQPLYHAGQILMYHGKYAEAEKYMHKAVTGYFSPLTMHEEEVWHDYGLALWHTGRGAEAVQNLQNALITNPRFPKGYNNLACALVIMGLSMQPADTQLVQQGLQAIEQAVGLVPGMPLYWRNAAALLNLAGDAEAGRNAWNQYRQLDPGTAASIEATGQMPQDCVWEFYFR